MSDEADALHKWLVAHGYPFELHVGRAVRDAGWYVEHSAIYNDLTTNKTREIDIHASLWISDEAVGPQSFAVELAIECKRTVGKPWVVFSAPNERQKFAFFNLPTVDTFSDDVRTVAVTQKLKIPAFLRQPRELGHGIVRAHSDNKSADPTAPYSALQSAISAALAFGRSNAELVHAQGLDSWPTAHVVLPTVVIDGSLYEYVLRDDGEPKLSPVPHIGVVAVNPRTGTQVSVTVVTKDALDQYLASLTAAAREFGARILPHVPEVCDSLRKRVERVGWESAVS